MNRIFPKPSDLKLLKKPLSDSVEKLVLKLDAILPKDWEIFIEPFLNGDRPALTLLNKTYGVVFVELYEWNVDELETHIKISRETNDKYRHYYIRKNTSKQAITNPIKSALRSRDNLIGIYEPQIGELIEAKNELAVFAKVAIYFPQMGETDIKKRFGEDLREIIVLSADFMEESADAFLDQLVIGDKTEMPADWYERIRYWISPPFHRMEDGTKIKLSSDQKTNVMPEPHKHTRVRGVAGSGKTMVLAMRAANLAATKKNVLIVTYNITLINYILHHINRASTAFDPSFIEIRHFHGFCKKILKMNLLIGPSDEIEAGDDNETKERKRKIYFGERIPNYIIERIQSGKIKVHTKYDAVLVDEGQDFERPWYELLNFYLSENDEFLIISDPLQNIYRKDAGWVDKRWSNSMSGTKFNKRWRELNDCYRLPVNLAREARRFSATFLPQYKELASSLKEVQTETFFDPHLIWFDISSADGLFDRIFESVQYLIQNKNQKPGDIVILVDKAKNGGELVSYLENKGISVNHIFGGDKNISFANGRKTVRYNKFNLDPESSNYRRKITLTFNDERLKVSTVHSFKGWESPNILLITPAVKNISEEKIELFYVAMTRCQQNFIVYNQNEKFSEFGKEWEHKFY